MLSSVSIVQGIIEVVLELLLTQFIRVPLI